MLNVSLICLCFLIDFCKIILYLCSSNYSKTLNKILVSRVPESRILGPRHPVAWDPGTECIELVGKLQYMSHWEFRKT